MKNESDSKKSDDPENNSDKKNIITYCEKQTKKTQVTQDEYQKQVTGFEIREIIDFLSETSFHGMFQVKKFMSIVNRKRENYSLKTVLQKLF